tara:strand:+ start:132 stop:533 length:402 start_codon:yes stop_codon:yes gene_type:complete
MEDVLKELLGQVERPAAPADGVRMKKVLLATAVLLTGLQKTVKQIAETVEQNSKKIDLQVKMRNTDVEQTEAMTELLNKIVLLLSDRTLDPTHRENASGGKSPATVTESRQQEEFAASLHLNGSSLDNIFSNE